MHERPKEGDWTRKEGTVDTEYVVGSCAAALAAVVNWSRGYITVAVFQSTCIADWRILRPDARPAHRKKMWLLLQAHY